MELSNRKALIVRARYLMTKYMYMPLDALKIAEQEYKEKEQKQREIELND